MAICPQTLAQDILHSTLKARGLAQQQADMHYAKMQSMAQQEEVARRVNAPPPRAELPRAYKEVAGLTDGFDTVRTDRAAQARLLGCRLN
ncbi:MAG: hypothetical protein ACJ8AT_15705 [Hyalangium sp.]|uniref:hypothetical protein n=1 Tax=Hyalangium sp. TaxID=2028555 RepID=UPI003899DF9E